MRSYFANLMTSAELFIPPLLANNGVKHVNNDFGSMRGYFGNKL